VGVGVGWSLLMPQSMRVKLTSSFVDNIMDQFSKTFQV